MPATELDRSGRAALWRQVVEDLRRRIDVGEFSTRFPGEKVLAEGYGVSRQTMRQALRPLRESGLVSAERGRPPRIRSGVIEQPMSALYSLFDSVESTGMSQHSRVLALDQRQDPAAAQNLGLPPQALLVHLARIRLADEEPLALDRVWLPASVAAPLLAADFGHTALYHEMENRIGDSPRRGNEVIEAITLDASDARQLAAREGSPAFRIERTGYSTSTTLEWRITVVRGDKFRVSTQFSPAEGPSWAFSTATAPAERSADDKGRCA